MRSSSDYAGFAQLCGRSPIMREIMRAHNRIIQRSLLARLTSPMCNTTLARVYRVLPLVLRAFLSSPVVEH